MPESPLYTVCCLRHSWIIVSPRSVEMPQVSTLNGLRISMPETFKYPSIVTTTRNMLFFSFFKTLTNQVVTIELKNDIRIRGTLKSVDQYLNIKLDDIDVLDLDKYPHLSSVKNMFIRGSVVRYVILPRSEVDVGLLEDATRREAANQAGKAR
ncbi:small nuclear ribonucleoprotein [Aspergillus rambellii]|uniref:Small nuclear ribonucleoprotein n=2 Tax=Aspergillus subgen. Nidulantes TaxID=2720870 RepID=A0A0F8WZ95_9EURO|nr:small nuclear ribonucleoprotein [Aspergillus rambellii]